MRQFRLGEGAMAVHQIGHAGLSGDVAVGGKAQGAIGGNVRISRILDILCAPPQPPIASISRIAATSPGARSSAPVQWGTL